MTTTQRKHHAPDPGGIASSSGSCRIVFEAERVLRSSVQVDRRFQAYSRRARTRALPALVDEQNWPDKRIYDSAHTKMR